MAKGNAQQSNNQQQPSNNVIPQNNGPESSGPVGDQTQGALAYKNYLAGPGSQGKLGFNYGAPGQGGNNSQEYTGPGFAPGMPKIMPNSQLSNMINNKMVQAGRYGNSGGMIGVNGQPLGEGPMLGKGGDPYWSMGEVQKRGGNTGINGGRMDGGRLAVMPQNQYTPQDRTNTMNRLNELHQQDSQYPVPFAGANPNDPRRNEMNVLEQRMMDMGNMRGNSGRMGGWGGGGMRPDVMPRMRMGDNDGGGMIQPQEQNYLARQAQGGGGLFGTMPGMGGNFNPSNTGMMARSIGGLFGQ